MKMSSALPYFLSFSLAFMPLHPSFAQEAPASHEAQDPGVHNIKEMIKEVGLTKSQNFRQLAEKIKPFVHAKIYNRLAAYAELHPTELAPTVELQEVQGGQNQIRVFVKSKGSQETFDLLPAKRVTGGTPAKAYQAQAISYKGKSYSYNDIFYDGQLEVEKKTNELLTFSEIKTLAVVNPDLAAAYLVKYKNLLSSLESYYLLNGQSEVAAQLMAPWWMETAQAAWSKDGEKCIVAGHLSEVKNHICGGDQFTCGADRSKLTCNALAYGFSEQGQFCVPRVPAENVSKECDRLSNERYKYTEDPARKNLLTDVVNNKQCQGLKVTPCEQEAYVKELRSHIRGAFEACSPIKGFEWGDNTGVGMVEAFERFRDSKRLKPPPQVSADDIQRSWVDPKSKKSAAGKKDSDEHHRNACATLMNRLFDLENAGQAATCTIDHPADQAKCPVVVPPVVAKTPAEPVPPPAPPLPTPEVSKAQPFDSGMPVVEVHGKRPPKKDDDNKSIIPWLIGGAIAVCLLAKCFGSNNEPMPKGKGGEPEIKRGGTTGNRPPVAPADKPGAK